MMQKHHLDVQISVQFIQVYPHHKKHELRFRLMGTLKPQHHISPLTEGLSV